MGVNPDFLTALATELPEDTLVLRPGGLYGQRLLPEEIQAEFSDERKH